jgi:LysR family glycine cleavage system transcriptional activator
MISFRAGLNRIHMHRLRSPLPPLSTLRPFEAAIRLGSFKAAAAELHLTQSAISHQISSLERHFQTKLFARQGNRLVPTKEGEAYGAAVARSLTDLSNAGSSFLKDDRAKVLRVTATPSFAMFAALPYVDSFKARNASLELRLEARNTSVDFETEDIDAAIAVGSAPFSGLQSHRLFRSRIGPLAHPDFCRKYGPVKAAKDLARLPLIELNNIPGLWDRWFAHADHRIKITDPPLASDSLLAAIQMAESGVGVLLAPFPLVTTLVSTGRLTPLFRPFMPIERPDFYLLHRKAQTNSAKIRALKHWLNYITTELDRHARAAGVW